ncbi:MAG: hypothetical protein OSJ70_01825 [Bacilli bacterium]|nr:hypothetical protein [Bacilli bacterium]
MNSEETKKLIIKSFNEEKNSHAFLFVTNNVDRCYQDCLDIIKKINCDTGSADNCDCNICNTIDKKTNPDVISVFPDGKEIKKDQVLEIIHKFSMKPSINKYSTYVIVNADKMNDATANKMLKFLEEPEGKIIGFYITDKLSAILPTIRSRCEIFNYRFGANSILDILEITEDEYGAYYDYATQLIKLLNNTPKYVLMSESKAFAKKERFEIEAILKLISKIYTIKFESVTVGKYSEYEFVNNLLDIIETNEVKKIVKRINLLDNIINDFKINVNKELFINKLFICWE